MQAFFHSVSRFWTKGLCVAILFSAYGAGGKTLQEMRNLVKSGKYAEAEKAFQPELHKDAPNLQILRLAMHCYQIQGKYISALFPLNRILDLQPKQKPDFLFKAAQLSEAAGADDKAVVRYKAFLQTADSSNKQYQAALMQLIKLQCETFNQPINARPFLERYLKLYGDTPQVLYYGKRVLQTLADQGRQRDYLDFSGHLMDKLQGASRKLLAKEMARGMVQGNMRRHGLPYARLANFFVAHRVKQPEVAQNILRHLSVAANDDKPNESLLEQRLEAGQKLGAFMLSSMKPENWPLELPRFTSYAFFHGQAAHHRNSGNAVWAASAEKAIRSQNPLIWRSFLAPLIAPVSLAPAPELLAPAHALIAKLGVKNCGKELAGLYELRRQIPTDLQKDQAAAKKEVQIAIHLFSNPAIADAFVALSSDKEVIDVLTSDRPAFDFSGQYRRLTGALVSAARAKRGELLNRLVRLAIESTPYSFNRGTFFIDSYARNAVVPAKLKAETLATLVRQYPFSGQLQELTAATEKWLHAQGKKDACNVLRDVITSPGKGDSKNPWTWYPRFAEAAASGNAAALAKVVQAFSTKFSPEYQFQGRGQASEVLLDFVYGRIAGPGGLKAPQRLDAFGAIADRLPPARIFPDLAQVKKWDQAKKLGTKLINEKILTAKSAISDTEMATLYTAVLTPFFRACDQSRDWAPLMATMPALCGSNLLSTTWRVQLISDTMQRLIRNKRDTRAYHSFLNQALNKLGAGALAISLERARALLSQYQGFVNPNNPAQEKQVRKLSEIALASGLSPERIATFQFEVARRSRGAFLDGWMRGALVVDETRLTLPQRRTLWARIYAVAPHEGWRNLFQKGKKNDIVFSHWLPLESEWIKTSSDPSDTFRVPWSKPWQHAWDFYTKVAQRDAKLKLKWQQYILNWGDLFLANLPVLHGAHFAIAREAMMLRLGRKDAAEAEKIDALAHLLGRSLSGKNAESDLRAMATSLNKTGYKEVTAALLQELLDFNGQLPASARKYADVMLTDIGPELGIFRIPVPVNSPEYDLFAASQEYVRGNKRQALLLFFPKSNLLADNWQKLNPEFVIYCVNALRKRKDYKQVLDFCFKVLLEEKNIPDEMVAATMLCKGDTYRDQEKFELAIVEYKSLLGNGRLKKTKAGQKAQFHLIDTYRVTRNYEAAQIMLDRLINNPSMSIQAKAYYYLALCMYDQDQLDDAEKYIEEVFRRKATDNDATLLEGRIALKKKLYYQAADLEIGQVMEQNSIIPGKVLSLKISDPNLGIARGSDAIPVVVTTVPGGDRELVRLRAGEENRSVFQGKLRTILGKAKPGNMLLEVTGSDSVSYTLSPAFQKANNLHFDAHKLVVVSNATLTASSGQFFTEEERKKRRLALELAQRSGTISRQQLGRDVNTIRPGNPIYVRVEDPDQDKTDQPDTVPVTATTSSKDRVKDFLLTETGPHTGIFQGAIPTGKPLPKASASDSSEGANPGWMINRSHKEIWSSAPNGIKPKWLEVDLQDPARINEMTVDFVKPKYIKRLTLFGAQLGDQFRKLGAYPAQLRYDGGLEVKAVLGSDFANADDIRLRMFKRVTLSDYIGYPRFRRDSFNELGGGSDTMNVRCYGRFALKKTQRLSFRNDFSQGEGSCFVFIDGKLVSEEAGEPYNLTLAKGAHELEILLLLKGKNAIFEIMHLNNEGDWVSWPADWFLPRLHPELLTLLKPKVGMSFADERLIASFKTDTRFRKLRLFIEDYAGDQIKVREIKITDSNDKVLVPRANDFSSTMDNDTLEISAGDKMMVVYRDNRRLREDKPELSAVLNSSFYDGSVSLDYEVIDEHRRSNYYPVKRVRVGDNLMIRVEDWDMDTTAGLDKVPVTLKVTGQKPVTMTALESGKHTGVFLATIKFRQKAGKDQVALTPGAEISIIYYDKENTDPGSGIERTYSVFEAGSSTPEIFVLKTSTRMKEVDKNTDRFGARRKSRRKRRRRKKEDTVKVLQKEVVGTFEEDEHNKPLSAKRVAIDSPLLFFVKYPSAALNELSTVTAWVYSESQAKAAKEAGEPVPKQKMVLTLAPLNELASRKGFGHIAFINLPGMEQEERLSLGLFSGVCKLQLGKAGDAVNDLVITPEAAFGSPESGSRRRQKKSDRVTTILIHGQDHIIIELKGNDGPVTQKVGLFCDGQLNFTDRTFVSPKDGFYLGENVYLQLTDLDLDVSDEIDTAPIELSSSSGDKMKVIMRETLQHSGVFTGVIKPEYAPKEKKRDTTDDVFMVMFGDTITATYNDLNNSKEEAVVRNATCKVFLGNDATVDTFSKRFKDQTVAVKTAFTIAEAYFEMAKEHRRLKKADLAKKEIQTGKHMLEEAMSTYPNTKFAAQAEYLLANLAQETQHYDEAIGRYTGILYHWPNSEYAPKAQFKLGLCYEKMTPPQWDAACEEYVKITYKYPNNPLVADVIIRLGQYFWRIEKYQVAGDVFKSFYERFKNHRLSSRALLLAGQSYIKAKQYTEAIDTLNELVKAFADDKVVRSEAMYWLADSYMQVKNNKDAYKTFKKLTWDYPETKWAKMARGRLVEDAFRGMEDNL